MPEQSEQYEVVFSGSESLPGYRTEPAPDLPPEPEEPDWKMGYELVKTRLLKRAEAGLCLLCGESAVYQAPTGSVWNGARWCLLCKQGRMRTELKHAEVDRLNERQAGNVARGACPTCGGPKPCGKCQSKSNARLNKIRIRRHAKGLCDMCGAEPFLPGLRVGEKCREKQRTYNEANAERKREYAREWRRKRREEGGEK